MEAVGGTGKEGAREKKTVRPVIAACCLSRPILISDVYVFILCTSRNTDLLLFLESSGQKVVHCDLPRGAQVSENVQRIVLVKEATDPGYRA